MPILKKHKNPLMVMVGELILLVVFCGYAVSLFFPPSLAKATSGMVPFGGKILRFVIATATPPCPPHSAVLDFRSNMIVGVYLTPNSRVYRYGNVYAPGAYVLGEYIPIPFASCPTPYAVYPIFQIGTNF